MFNLTAIFVYIDYLLYNCGDVISYNLLNEALQVEFNLVKLSLYKKFLKMNVLSSYFTVTMSIYLFFSKLESRNETQTK